MNFPGVIIEHFGTDQDAVLTFCAKLTAHEKHWMLVPTASLAHAPPTRALIVRRETLPDLPPESFMEAVIIVLDTANPANPTDPADPPLPRPPRADIVVRNPDPWARLPVLFGIP